MKLPAIGAAFAALAMAGQAGQDLPPWVVQLSRVKLHARADFEHIPNYTCLETVDRFERGTGGLGFARVDSLRFEVASVGGRELFAREGATQFESEDLADYVHGGLFGSGVFSATVSGLFVRDNGRTTGWGVDRIHGKPALRYDFEISAMSSGFVLRSNRGEATVGERGSFWADPKTLDVLRIEAHAVDIPPEFGMRAVDTVITYARVSIGAAGALLPKSAQLAITSLSGRQSRNLIEFSNCREYTSKSTIHFDAPVIQPPTAPAKE